MSPSVARFLDLFAEDLAVRFRETTTPGYLLSIRMLLAWLDERGLDLVDVRPDDLAAYQSHLLASRKKDGKPYSSGSQMNHVKAVKCFFRFLCRRGFLVSDPASRLMYPRMEKRLPRSILTTSEARRIIESPNVREPRGLRDRAILETLYATGLRVSELTHLKPDDVDTQERVVRVIQGKGRKDRYVPLTRPAASAIERYLSKGRARLTVRCACLFVASRGGPMNRWMVDQVVHRYAKAARVDKRVTCHTFRHSVATHLLRRRADIRHIQALLGHASLSTTERYTRVEMTDLKAVLRRAHPRG